MTERASRSARARSASRARGDVAEKRNEVEEERENPVKNPVKNPGENAGELAVNTV